MKRWTANLEIAFWDFVTPLLSESPTVRWIFRTGAEVMIEKKKSVLVPLLVLSWATLGLLAGFLLGRSGWIQLP